VRAAAASAIFSLPGASSEVPPPHMRTRKRQDHEPVITRNGGAGARAVKSAMLGSVAVTFLAACGEDDLARCVDRTTSELVDVSRCDAEAADGYGGRYYWNFGGSSDTNIGSRVSGGDNIDPADQAAISQRGGFGANQPTSGTGVRELASTAAEEEDGDRKKSSGSSGKSSGG
jgi:hypothetical protein